MKVLSYKNFLDLSPALAAKYLHDYIDGQEEELPRRYLDEVMKSGHCMIRHSTGDYDFFIDRPVVRPPDLKHPNPQYSTFESEAKARYVIGNTLYASARSIASRITDYRTRTKDDIEIKKHFGGIPCPRQQN